MYSKIGTNPKLLEILKGPLIEDITLVIIFYLSLLFVETSYLLLVNRGFGTLFRLYGC